MIKLLIKHVIAEQAINVFFDRFMINSYPFTEGTLIHVKGKNILSIHVGMKVVDVDMPNGDLARTFIWCEPRISHIPLQFSSAKDTTSYYDTLNKNYTMTPTRDDLPSMRSYLVCIYDNYTYTLDPYG